MRFAGKEASAHVREWLERHRVPFQIFDDPRSSCAPLTLVERRSGKRITFSVEAVLEAEEAADSKTGARYLRVLLDDGRGFGLAGVGIVFAPSFLATGPLPDCPSSACFFDYEKLFRHLEHLVNDPHEGAEREALQVLMVLLAFVEGARLIGIDVADEERELEGVLEKLERIGVAPY